MQGMFDKKKFKPESSYSHLFMNQSNIKKISELGHSIGLHSHSHPTLFEKLTFKEQLNEYKENYNILTKIIGTNNKINSASHPCGSYNYNTLSILDDIGIKIGFRNLLNGTYKKTKYSNLEIGRQNHSEIIKFIEK